MSQRPYLNHSLLILYTDLVNWWEQEAHHKSYCAYKQLSLTVISLFQFVVNIWSFWKRFKWGSKFLCFSESNKKLAKKRSTTFLSCWELIYFYFDQLSSLCLNFILYLLTNLSDFTTTNWFTYCSQLLPYSLRLQEFWSSSQSFQFCKTTKPQTNCRT